MVRRLIPCLLVVAATATGALSLGASKAAATPLNCPAPFQVLHDDAIGPDFLLPAGGYLIKVADPNRISCTTAFADFAEFLSDYDGVLRKPWVQVPQRQIFSRGDGSLTAFSVRRVANLDPAIPTTGNPTANACPGFFHLRHGDHLAGVPLPEAPYRITLFDPTRLTCAKAATQLARFLQDEDGVPTAPWRFDPKTASFRAGKDSPVGFRVKLAVGAEPVPSAGRQFPPKGSPRECTGVLRVRGGDRINGLNLPGGTYLSFPLRGSGLSCKRVARLFGAFLRARNNAAPKGWHVDPGNGVFRHGKRAAFRVKPALPPVAKKAR